MRQREILNASLEAHVVGGIKVGSGSALVTELRIKHWPEALSRETRMK